MDWKNQMNEAIEYIESHLTREMDYEELARITLCSEYEFRRIFSLFAKISLSEYIRLRRLTVVVDELRKGQKIIDVAYKYGYESQAAFSRAFKRFHGVSASSAKKEGVVFRYFPRLIFKVLLMEEKHMGEHPNGRVNIIGPGEVSVAVSLNSNQEDIHRQNEVFWNEVGSEAIGITALPMYGSYVSEDKLHLMGNLCGKNVLEIGCGSGSSLVYLSKKKPASLWGIDISPEQIKKAKQCLEAHKVKATLICAPMEAESNLPKEQFDLVFSVYGIGWTADLLETFQQIYSYLKPGGSFIFSWSHPIHKCVAYDQDMLIFKKSYFDESWYSVNLQGGTYCLADRKLSTYINALAKAGFVIEELVEESDQEMIDVNKESTYSKKAAMLPVTFVIKARKN